MLAIRLLSAAARAGRACLLAALPLVAAAAPADAGQYLKDASVEIEVQPDATYTLLARDEMVGTDDASAQALAQQAISYSESMNELDILEAHTLKADGRKLSVDVTSIFSQLPPGHPQVPMFTDLHQKVIVFPDVAAGDTISFGFRRRVHRAQLPGFFMYPVAFPRSGSYKSVHYVVRTPKSLPLQIEAHDLKVEQHTTRDEFVYTLNYAAFASQTEDFDTTSPIDRAPRAFFSSARSYDDVARAYAALVKPHIQITPSIRALADEITAHVDERERQAQRIYEWVSRHIRYVAILLENGGMVPHDAESVLANGYGDCKDHVVLFAALLAAKGIASEPVIINLGNGYRISEVPTFAQLNHLISWLPEFGIYADTTAAVAPFGTLPFEEYGKPVVHVVDDGAPARRQTPTLSPGLASSDVRSVSRVTADGTLTNETTITATGPFSIILRKAALAIQAKGPERAVSALLRSHNLEGNGRFEFSPPSDLAPDYTIVGRYTGNPELRYLNGDAFTVGAGNLALLAPPGDYLMGPLMLQKLSDQQPTPCFSGTQTFEGSVELPPGKRIARLPAPTEIHDAHFDYASQWQFEGRRFTVRRRLSTHFDQPLCTGDVRKAAGRVLAQIREDYRTQVSISAE